MRISSTTPTPLSWKKCIFSGALIPVLGIIILLSACQLKPKVHPGPIEKTTPQPQSDVVVESGHAETASSGSAPTGLTPNLLYDLLAGSIARQRNENEMAFEFLSRAAYQSRDKEIIAEALHLAMQTSRFQQAADLAQRLDNIDPGNYRVILSLANAQFQLGAKDIAFSLLIDLASEQDQEQLNVFHDISTLLSQQDQHNILDEYVKHLNKDTENNHQDNLGVNMVAAILAFKLEESNMFSQFIKTTLELVPDWEAATMLKFSYLSKKDIVEAHTYAQSNIDAFPEQERFRILYVRSLIQSNKFDNALDQLSTLLQKNETSLEALFLAGVLYLDQNRSEKAKTMFEKYFKIDNQNDQVRLYLSEIEKESGNFSKAMSYLYGVSSERFYFDAQIKLAEILTEQEGVESGLKYLDQIDVRNETEQTKIILEKDFLLRNNDMPERAKAILDTGLKRFPGNPDLLYNRGLLAAQMELLELHEMDMRKLIEIQPENAHAYNALGYTLADKTNRFEEAMKLISTANELLPDNPFILDSMGWVHFRLGNNDEAIHFLRRALDHQNDPEIAAHLGEVLWITGATEAARKIWNQGREWEPDNIYLKNTIERLTNTQSRVIRQKMTPDSITDDTRLTSRFLRPWPSKSRLHYIIWQTAENSYV